MSILTAPGTGFQQPQLSVTRETAEHVPVMTFTIYTVMNKFVCY